MLQCRVSLSLRIEDKAARNVFKEISRRNFHEEIIQTLEMEKSAPISCQITLLETTMSLKIGGALSDRSQTKLI